MPPLSTEPEGATRVFNVNATTTTYPSITDGTSRPSTDGMFGMYGKNEFLLWPFGVGSDNDDFEFRLYGWWDGRLSWKPTLLFAATAVLCTEVGVANGDVLNTERYVDTITRLSSGAGGVAPAIVSPQLINSRSVVRVDGMGCAFVQMIVDRDAGSSAATSVSALVSRF